MENTLENNKLIAEFMGLEKVDGRFYMHALKQGFVKHRTPANSLQYDYSWDWLMSVVDKIKSTENLNFDFDMKLHAHCTLRTVAPIASGMTYDIQMCEPYKGIETIYKAVILFINWYNENK